MLPHTQGEDGQFEELGRTREKKVTIKPEITECAQQASDSFFKDESEGSKAVKLVELSLFFNSQ